MALLFCDSFDHYTTLTRKWDVVNSAASINAAAGRNGSAGLMLAADIFDRARVRKNVGQLSSFVLGAAVKINTAQTATALLFGFVENATYQLDLQCSLGGLLRVTRANNLLGQSTQSLSFGKWYYIEYKALIDDAVGYVEVRVDGVPWVSVSGVDTKESANAWIAAVTLNAIQLNQYPGGTSSSGWAIDYDDVYFCDLTGGYCNNFLGDVRVQAVVPDGAGSSAQWTPSAGSNYECVDESAPNEDTDYVSSDNPDDQDLYSYENLSSGAGLVKAVVVVPRHRKDDAGTRTIRALAKSGETTGESEDIAVNTDYAYSQRVFEVNPNTGQPWTIAEVNAAEFGVKVQE